MSQEEETGLLTAHCSSCNHEWSPFGNQSHYVPFVANLACPNCGDRDDHVWLDKEGKRLKALKLTGLEDRASSRKLLELENEVGLLKSKVETLTKQNELTEAKLKEQSEWAKKREESFQLIEQVAGELEEEERFKREGV